MEPAEKAELPVIRRNEKSEHVCSLSIDTESVLYLLTTKLFRPITRRSENHCLIPLVVMAADHRKTKSLSRELHGLPVLKSWRRTCHCVMGLQSLYWSNPASRLNRLLC